MRFRFAPPLLRDGAAPGLAGLIMEAQLTMNRDVVRVAAWPDLAAQAP